MPERFNSNSLDKSDSSCEDCVLHNTITTEDFDLELVKNYKKSKTLLSLKKGEFLFKSGEKCSHIYCIKSGIIRMSKEHRGSLITMWPACKGELLGIQSFMGNKRYKFTAIAMYDCELCVIPATVFTRLLQKQNELYLMLMKIISQRLGMINKRLEVYRLT